MCAPEASSIPLVDSLPLPTPSCPRFMFSECLHRVLNQTLPPPRPSVRQPTAMSDSAGEEHFPAHIQDVPVRADTAQVAMLERRHRETEGKIAWNLKEVASARRRIAALIAENEGEGDWRRKTLHMPF